MDECHQPEHKRKRLCFIHHLVTLFTASLLLAGGCYDGRWIERDRKLTADQLKRQQELISELNLLQSPEKLIDRPEVAYHQLIELSNEYFMKDDLTIHVFHTKGSNDDGSDGKLVVVIRDRTIISAEHQGIEK